MQKSINRQSGFAIGTILLAVVLIAAIVSAIAIASRGSQSQGNREEARVNASTLMSQGINLRNGYERLIGAGTQPSLVTASADTDSSAIGTAASCTGNITRTGADAGTFDCFYGTGGTSPQVPPRKAFPNNGSPIADRYHFKRSGVSGINANTTAIVYVADISRSVCQQINNLANNWSINTAPPAITTAIDLTTAGNRLEVTMNLASGATAPTGGVATSQWQEGCFVTNGTDDPTNESAQYMYFKGLNG